MHYEKSIIQILLYYLCYYLLIYYGNPGAHWSIKETNAERKVK